MNQAALQQQLQQMLAAAAAASSPPAGAAPAVGGMPQFQGGNIIYGLAPTFGMPPPPGTVGNPQGQSALNFMLPGTGLRPPTLPGSLGAPNDLLSARPPPPDAPRIAPPPPTAPPEPHSSSRELASGAPPPQAPAEKPKPCHLHKKPNKTCKFCRRFTEQTEALAADQAQHQQQQHHPATSSSSTSAPSDEKVRPVFQCSPILKDQILKAPYFKSLMQITTVDALAEEIQNFCTNIDIYRPGSAVEPSEFLCCVFRLFTMDHTEEELGLLLDHPRSLCARCVGFLYLRFAERPERLWDALGDYVLDEMDFSPLQGKQPGAVPATVGEYVESILMKEKYFGTPLPRLPVAVRRKLEEKVAPLPQCRKRAQANRNQLKLFREKGAAVEFCQDGEWIEGNALDVLSRTPTRLKINILVDGKDQVQAHLGRVILRDKGSRARSRSRSRSRGKSPDWSRHKGKSDATMVQELREASRAEAVCASGKDYAKRPMGFEAGLAVRREQGSAETQLMQEDAAASLEGKKRRRVREEDEPDRDLARMRRTEEEQERQRKLMQIYEKYGSQGTASHTSGGGGAGSGGDFDKPDVMRLG